MKKLRKSFLRRSVKMLRKSYGIRTFPQNDNVVISRNRGLIRVISDEEEKKYCATPVLMSRKEKREIIFTSKMSS